MDLERKALLLLNQVRLLSSDHNERVALVRQRYNEGKIKLELRDKTITLLWEMRGSST